MSRTITLAVAALSVTALMSLEAQAGCRGGGGHGRSSSRLSIAYSRNLPHMRSHAPRHTNNYHRAPVHHAPVRHTPVYQPPVVVQPVVQPVIVQSQVVAPPTIPTFAPVAPQATPAVTPAPAPAAVAPVQPVAQPIAPSAPAEKSPEQLALEALAAFAD